MTLSSEDKKIILDSIRDIPDFPKPGIIFKDITTLLSSPLHNCSREIQPRVWLWRSRDTHRCLWWKRML